MVTSSVPLDRATGRVPLLVISSILQLLQFHLISSIDFFERDTAATVFAVSWMSCSFRRHDCEDDILKDRTNEFVVR
jgi:hypothetical protein